VDSLFSSICLIDTHSDLTRNIVSLRVSENLFDDLTEDHEAWKAAQLLELETKPRLFGSNQPIIDRPFEEAEWNNAIGYPFQNSSESRFSDGTYGVWYGSDSIETTVYETAYHWQRGLLEDAGFNKPGVVIERRIYLVQCDSALLDLRPLIESHPEILHPTDYTATHAIGRKIHREGHPGLVTQSARTKGEVYAIFTPKVLLNPRHSCYLTYVTTDDGVEIQRTPGTTWLKLRI
jgi:hypothetical protein